MPQKTYGIQTYQLRYGFILSVIFLAVYKIFGMPPIPQDPAYHLFADTRSFAGIPNIGNVASNVGFIIAGIVGWVRCRTLEQSFEAFMWKFFFGSVILVGLGSGYYHLQPTNNTLFWDRLPMTMAFGALTACICGERFGARVGKIMFRPMVLISVFSVIYWWVSEAAG